MTLKQNLCTDEEEKIIQLKYAAPQIRMCQNVQDWSMILLLNIHVITGWVIPENPLKKILIDQFEKKLIEDYDMLNVKEIEYAFRKSGTLIKDWGKEMNLNLIDQVLSPYVTNRLQASANEESRSKPPEQKIYTKEEVLNQRRAYIEGTFQGMRKGHLPIIFDYFKEVLEEDELLNEGESVVDFFVRVLNSGTKNLYVKE